MAIVYKEVASNKRRTAFLIGIFLILVISLGWAFSYIYEAYWILPFAVFFASFQALTAYWWSDKITLAISGAKEVVKKDAPELYRIVENLSITAGLPTPRVYIINDSAPNAFATGRDPEHAVVAVTSGLLEKLTKQELEGVIAHELSHIGNYDIRLMTIVVVLVGIVTLIADWFLRFSFFGRDSNNRNSVVVVIGLVLALLSPLFAMLIKLSLSRKREYLADADGVLLTRYAEGLASALEKISADREPLEAANKATAHLYIANPLKEHQGKDSIGWFAGLFSTHPPTEERVRRLRKMGT
jgi:heat shock protein HtpX